MKEILGRSTSGLVLPRDVVHLLALALKIPKKSVPLSEGSFIG